jgi:hypothetical protein
VRPVRSIVPGARAAMAAASGFSAAPPTTAAGRSRPAANSP